MTSPVPPGEHDVAPADLADVQRMFVRFAEGFPDLRLYRRICEGVAGDDDVAGLLTVAQPGQMRPVLLLAALHDLVLRRPEVPAARWYPTVTGGPMPSEGDPWPELRAACLDHADELRAVIAGRRTQTNEVNRAVHIMAMVAQACTDTPGSPVALVEMGCSAGLLLGLDRYRIEIRSRVEDAPDAAFGPRGSTVQCGGEQLAGPPLRSLVPPSIVERVGIDQHPVPLGDEDEIRWLLACLWPDTPERCDRFRAAVDLLRPDPPDLVAGDMVSDLGAVAHSARAVATASSPVDGGVHLIVFSSWALTYVERGRRTEVADTLADLATDGRPVTWLTAEPAGCVPEVPAPPELPADRPEADGRTVLGARRWRNGVELSPAVWGTCHAHGEWLRWSPPRVDPVSGTTTSA